MGSERINVRNFRLWLETERVLHLAGCTKKNPVYPGWRDTLQRLWKENLGIWYPQAFIREIEFSEGRSGLACLFTLGGEVTRKMETLKEGDMEEVYLLDCLASQLMFQMDEQLQERIRELCRKKRRGIAGRLEAPGDYSFQVQEAMLAAIGGGDPLPVKITSGSMLVPEKSMLIFYEYGNDENCLNVEHNCADCGKADCVMRKHRSGE